jgi:hypothetical protein
MNTADLVSKQRELIEQEIELAELQAHGEPYSSRNLPIESVHKYGRDLIDVRDEDRAEIEGICGIIDRSECLICELKNSATPEAQIATNTIANPREAFVRPILEEKGWSIPDWATNATVDFHTANNYLKKNSNPYESTRKKLADALGVATTDLPR